MPTVEETLKAMQERIAQLEKQLEEQKGEPKRKRIIKIESDEDYDLPDVPPARGKAIRSETALDIRDSFKNDPDQKKPVRKANVKVLRLTGAGKQNIDVPDPVERTIEELIDELDITKPGAKAFIEGNIEAHRIAVEDGTWTENKCYQLHHQCHGAVIAGQFPRHQISPTCGYCISRKGGPCRIMEDGADCERCTNHGQLCLTYEDLSDVYKKFEASCPITQKSLEKWPLLQKWLETQTANKIKYGVELVEAHINDRTEEVPHALPGVEPCKLRTRTSESGFNKPPRGWVMVYCDEAVVHRRKIAFINLLRFRHLLKAFEDNDMHLVDAIVKGIGQVVHRCKPVAGKYCWEWTHTVFQSSDENAVRDHYCFTGRRLCVCDVPCLYNGAGGRFVPNVNPTRAEYKGWKPAPGRNGRNRYDTAEVGACRSGGDVEIIGQRASASREIFEVD